MILKYSNIFSLNLIPPSMSIFCHKCLFFLFLTDCIEEKTQRYHRELRTQPKVVGFTICFSQQSASVNAFMGYNLVLHIHVLFTFSFILFTYLKCREKERERERNSILWFSYPAMQCRRFKRMTWMQLHESSAATQGVRKQDWHWESSESLTRDEDISSVMVTVVCAPMSIKQCGVKHEIK